MSLIFVILGAVGAVLSAFKNRWCFAVWAPCNLYWIWFNWPGIQSWVFLIMTASCLAGWMLWKGGSIREQRLQEENAIFREGWTQSQDTIIELKAEIKELEDRASGCVLCTG